MLSELSIENFAIIDRLLVRFGAGFTVLTGETGAGKSIIIDALQAALGARLQADVVRPGARFAVAEAVFVGEELEDPAVRAALENLGIPTDDSLILRREVTAAGRSSARLNGRAVPLAAVQDIGGLLVDIHGQSDHLSILRRDRQLEVLDRFGCPAELRAQVAVAVRAYQSARRELERLAESQRDAEQKLDLLRFQVQEIDGAELALGEEDELTAERNLLANAERLRQLSQTALESLQAEAGGATELVAGAGAAVRELATIDPSVTRAFERIEAARYELEDISQELRAYGDGIEYDPRRLDSIEERLGTIGRLRRKYGPEIQDVLDFGARARRELEEAEHFDERLAELDARVAEATGEAGERSAELSACRQSASRGLSDAMASALDGLGLKSTNFEVVVSQEEIPEGLMLPDGRRVRVSPSGVDSASFLVSFNPGEPVRPLERVASGGETSRFLLALKSVLSQADRTPTLVFDEVDVGIGGRHGRVVGERLRGLARNHQVLTITHMPQIAALADEHVSVAKAVRDERTVVEIRSLSKADRVQEIAEMMSGTGSDAARRNARELLEAAQRDG